MDARENPEEPKLWSDGENQYVYFDFDHSSRSVAAFYPKTKTRFGDVDHMKRMAMDALEKARADRTNSIVLETLSGDSSEISVEDSDVKSSRRHRGYAVDDISEDERCIEDLLCEEGVKKKVELLAGMVGVDSTKPGVVLSEVVRFLKGFREAKRISPAQMNFRVV